MKIPAVARTACVLASSVIFEKFSNLRYLFHKAIQLFLCRFFKPAPCKHFFASSFYESFKVLLNEHLVNQKEHFSSALRESAATFIRAAGFQEKITAYENMTHSLRSELEANPGCVHLQTLCSKIYKQNLFPAFRQLLETEFKIQSLESVQALSSHDFHQFLESQYDRFATDWSFNDNHGPSLYDPRMRGDIPSLVYSLNFRGKDVEVIRTPNVTIDSRVQGVWSSKVAPEFEGFLKTTSKHLYVNLMWTKHDNSEHKRSDQIQNLSRRHPHFVFVSLDKDSFFYHQKFNDNKPDAALFKQSFLDYMIKRDNFRFPDDLDISKELGPLIEKIHADFFENRAILTTSERKDFIELSYCAFIEYLSAKYEVKSLNVSCKSTVDRGASTLCMLHAYHKRHAREPVDKAMMTTMVFGPSLGAKNRAMLLDRFQRMSSTLKRLMTV